MKAHLKYGVSAIAIVAAFSLAQAQQGQQGGGASQQTQGAGAGQQTQGGGAGQQAQGEQSQKGGASRQSAMENRGDAGNTAQERGDRAEDRAGGEGTRGAAPGDKRAQNEKMQGENRQGQQDRDKDRAGGEGKYGAAPGDKRAQHENMQGETREGQRMHGERTAKHAPSQERQDQDTQRREDKAEGGRPEQRESSAGAAARSEHLGREGRGTSERTSIHISGDQRSQLHDVIRQHADIRRYHRGDVRFNVAVGARIPENIVFVAPPPRFVEIQPDFRRYRIVVLDDEILVVDPDTREIVDIIPA